MAVFVPSSLCSSASSRDVYDGERQTTEEKVSRTEQTRSCSSNINKLPRYFPLPRSYRVSLTFSLE
jgi:hypothetical protein